MQVSQAEMVFAELDKVITQVDVLQMYHFGGELTIEVIE